MGRFKNIAKTVILLTAILLLAGTRYAFAQNTSTNPYVNSTHLYRVPMGSLSNAGRITWQLMEDDYTTPTGSPLSVTDDLAWADTSLIDAAVDSAGVEIKFIESNFSTGDIWYLVYSESNSNSCIALRVIRIDITVNTFSLSLPPDNSECNNYSGTVITNTIGDISLENLVDSVEFTVNMSNGNPLFLIDKWHFTGSFVITEGSVNLYNAEPFTDMSGKSANGGDWTITGVGSNFTLEVVFPSGDYNGSADAVTFKVNVEGNMAENFKIQLTVSGGQAESGTNFITITDDNVSLGGGDRKVERTIYAIPNVQMGVND